MIDLAPLYLTPESSDDIVNERIRGLELWSGESAIDGGPIVAIATLFSENTKTGNMVQVWILRADKNPIAALNTGQDKSVCGGCPLRGKLRTISTMGHPLGASAGETTSNYARGCYVRVDQAPHQVWHSWNNRTYPAIDWAKHSYLFAGRMIRFGAYGDMTALPIDIADRIISAGARGWTGYTHQWRAAKFQDWAKYLHASTHTEAESRRAISMGWKCFQVSEDIGGLSDEGFLWCPAGDGVTCEACGVCCGSAGGNRAIRPHGSPATVASARKVGGN